MGWGESIWLKAGYLLFCSAERCEHLEHFVTLLIYVNNLLTFGNKGMRAVLFRATGGTHGTVVLVWVYTYAGVLPCCSAERVEHLGTYFCTEMVYTFM